MPTPQNPIDLSKVPFPDYEVEARIQSILYLWLSFYFSGNPFMTKDCDGMDIQKTYQKCDFLFNQGKLEQPLAKTLIHLHLVDDRDKECVSGNSKSVTDNLTWNVFVKTSGNKDCVDSEEENRQVASRLKHLMRSSEVQALVFAGVGRLNVRRGPAVVASRDLYIRQFIIEVQGGYCVGRNLG